MNPRKTQQAHGTQPPRQSLNQPQAHQPNLIQRKVVGSQVKQPPAAPPVYRPQLVPKVLQPKMSNQSQPVNQRKPASVPPIYRPQPTPRVLQTKQAKTVAPPSAASVAPAINKLRAAPQVLQAAKVAGVTRPASQSVLQRTVARFPTNMANSLPRTIQADARARSFNAGVVQRAMSARKEKAAASMIWNEFVPISMPSPKHILEKMKSSDAKGRAKVSVVEQAIALDAVQKIGTHVRKYGWNSADDIVIQWVAREKSFKIIYNQNEWMTHSSSGQLWPLRGVDIFSPPEGEDVSKLCNTWKSTRKRPAIYFAKRVASRAAVVTTTTTTMPPPVFSVPIAPMPPDIGPLSEQQLAAMHQLAEAAARVPLPADNDDW